MGEKYPDQSLHFAFSTEHPAISHSYSVSFPVLRDPFMWEGRRKGLKLTSGEMGLLWQWRAGTEKIVWRGESKNICQNLTFVPPLLLLFQVQVQFLLLRKRFLLRLRANANRCGGKERSFFLRQTTLFSSPNICDLTINTSLESVIRFYHPPLLLLRKR